MSDIYYRFEDELLYSDCQMVVNVVEFKVVRKTRKGAWIKRLLRGWSSPCGPERFVLDGTGKRYAYPSKEAAFESYKIRKRRQVMHLEAGLVRAKAAIEGIESPDFEVGKPFENEGLCIFHEY